jgi:uncharacterized protein YkwD
MSHGIPYCEDAFARRVRALVNLARLEESKRRKALGLPALPALAGSVALGRAAMHKALDMATTELLSHRMSDGSDLGANQRAHGYGFTTHRGEVLWAADHPATAEQVVAVWLGSRAHRAALLGANFRAFSFGRADAGTDARLRWWFAGELGGRIDAAAPVC